MAKKTEHIHKYHRVKLGEHVVYKCALINCTHFIRQELVEGRLSICWRCETTFPITKLSAKLMRPHCISCTKSAKKDDVAILKDYLEKLANG